MTAPRVFPDRIIRQLVEAYADAEDDGRALSTVEIQAIAGADNRIAAKVRATLEAAGLLTLVAPPKNNRPAICKLTPAAWAKIGRTPKPPPRPRTCLRCRTEFVPDGPMFFCNPCKESDDWRLGAALPLYAGAGRVRGVA